MPPVEVREFVFEPGHGLVGDAPPEDWVILDRRSRGTIDPIVGRRHSSRSRRGRSPGLASARASPYPTYRAQTRLLRRAWRLAMTRPILSGSGVEVAYPYRCTSAASGLAVGPSLALLRPEGRSAVGAEIVDRFQKRCPTGRAVRVISPRSQGLCQFERRPAVARRVDGRQRTAVVDDIISIVQEHLLVFHPEGICDIGDLRSIRSGAYRQQRPSGSLPAVL